MLKEIYSNMVTVDDVSLQRIRFGHNRFLKRLGVAMFGLAIRLAMPDEAEAHHNGSPSPCYGYNECHGCYSSGGCPSCTAINTVGANYCNGPEGTNGYNCWYTYTPPNRLYKCCDYKQDFPGGGYVSCLCRTYIYVSPH